MMYMILIVFCTHSQELCADVGPPGVGNETLVCLQSLFISNYLLFLISDFVRELLSFAQPLICFLTCLQGRGGFKI